MKTLQLAIAVMVFGALNLSSQAFAQTPDGETPANEGVCDDLVGATPGLYGLCIAYCEAQDCEPDFSLDNPFENCKPSSEKLLANYNKKKGPGDPDMPCIAPTPSCPCWTEQELVENVYGNIRCVESRTYDPDTGSRVPFWTIIGDGDVGPLTGDFAMTYNDELMGATWCGEKVRSCAFNKQSPSRIYRDFCITKDEYETCRASIHALADVNGVECIEY